MDGPGHPAGLGRLVAEVIEGDAVHLGKEREAECLRLDLHGAGDHGAHHLGHAPDAVVADEGADEEFLGVLVEHDEVRFGEGLEVVVELGRGESHGLAGPSAQGQRQQPGVVQVGLADEEEVEPLLLLREGGEVVVFPDGGEDSAVSSCHGVASFNCAGQGMAVKPPVQGGLRGALPDPDSTPGCIVTRNT
ncbi:hypothetical protein RB200_19690 [Streptomyces sp. PmtG]